VTTFLTDHFEYIAIEDLNIKGMMANGKLARTISDLGCMSFVDNSNTNRNSKEINLPYFTKGSSLEDITDEQIKAVADKLNNRPRKCLGFKTPYEVFYGKILEAGYYSTIKISEYFFQDKHR
jgi:hypothetical protein